MHKSVLVIALIGVALGASMLGLGTWWVYDAYSQKNLKGLQEWSRQIHNWPPPPTENDCSVLVEAHQDVETELTTCNAEAIDNYFTLNRRFGLVLICYGFLVALGSAFLAKETRPIIKAGP